MEKHRGTSIQRNTVWQYKRMICWYTQQPVNKSLIHYSKRRKSDPKGYILYDSILEEVNQIIRDQNQIISLWLERLINTPSLLSMAPLLAQRFSIHGKPSVTHKLGQLVTLELGKGTTGEILAEWNCFSKNPEWILLSELYLTEDWKELPSLSPVPPLVNSLCAWGFVSLVPLIPPLPVPSTQPDIA